MSALRTHPPPPSYSTSSRSFPLLSYSRRCRIPRHTAVSVCRTASPSLCIHARPVRVIHQTRVNHWKRVSSLRVCPSIGFRADMPVRPYNVLSCRGICDAITSMWGRLSHHVCSISIGEIWYFSHFFPIE